MGMYRLSNEKLSFFSFSNSSYFIVLSLVDPYKMNDDGRRILTKFNCSNDENAQKVSLETNLSLNLQCKYPLSLRLHEKSLGEELSLGNFVIVAVTNLMKGKGRVQ